MKNERNAGRKPKRPEDRRYAINVTLPPQLIAKLRDGEKSVSATVEAALLKYFRE